MDAIKEYIGIGHVDGVVEIDDTFIRASYKGRHTENSVFKMPRKPTKEVLRLTQINQKKRKEVLVKTK